MAFEEFLIGKRERMSWIAETSYGSGGTMSGGEVVGNNMEIEPDFSSGWQEVLTAGADELTVESRVPGPLVLPYTMNFVPVNWRWLKWLMAVADADDSGTKTHTFTVRNSILSYNLEWAKRHTTSHVLTLAGNVAKSATLSWSKATGEGSDGFINVALNCVAQTVTQGSSVTSLSALTKDPFQYRMAKLTLNGNEIVEVNNGEMTIEVGIDENDSRYCNSTLDANLGEPIPKVFRITGRMNVNIKDKTFYDMWVSRAVVGSTNTLLFDKDGTGNDQMLFTFGDFYVYEGVAPTTIDGVTNVDLVFNTDTFSSVVARDDISTY